MKLSSLMCFLAAALAIAVLAVRADRNDRANGWIIEGCDSFGYSEMAVAIRQARKTGKPTDYFLHDEQTRWLVAQCKELHLPLADWKQAVTTHAFHYFPDTDQVGPQYPPGTAWMLSLFPRRSDVDDLNRWSILCVAAGGLLLAGWCAWRGLPASSLVLAGATGAFLAPFSWIESASFSINATVLPLFAGTVLAWLASRRLHWGLALPLGLAAGLLIGLAVLVRLPTALLVPAVAMLFLPRRFGGLAGFLAGVALGGILPLLLHNHAVTGAFLGSTYEPYDQEQGFASVSQNVWFYFVHHARETGVPYVTGLLAATAIWLAAAGPLRAPGAQPWLRGHLWLLAAVLWALGISSVYFLTHVITTIYYLTPAMMLVCLLLGLLFVELETRWQETAVSPEVVRAVRTALAGAAGMAVCVGLGFGYRDLKGWVQNLSQPRTTVEGLTVPPELLDAHAWVWADQYGSSILYYTGHPAFKMGWTSVTTRHLLFDRVRARGEAQYVVLDGLGMQGVEDDARAAGWQLLPAGTVRGKPCFKLEHP